MKGVKVFEVSATEFWAGSGSPEAILNAYLVARGRAASATIPMALSDAALDSLKIEFDEDGQPMSEPVTFRQYLDELLKAHAEFPRFFASLQGFHGKREPY